MTRVILLAACAIAMSACTTVKLNHDNTNTISHKGGAAEAQELATRACRKAGERSAVIVSTVNKDPDLPPGTGTQLTTFRCSSDDR